MPDLSSFITYIQVLISTFHYMQEKLRAHIEAVLPLTEDEFSFVSSHFTIENYRRREFIIRQGESVKYCYFVVSGLLMLTYGDQSGKQHIVSFAMEEWWESDFRAFHNRAKATMSLQCLEDTAVLRLSLEDYHSLCSGLRKMERFFLDKSNSGHIGSQQRILSFLTSSARERYQQLLEQHPALVRRVPRTLLASYLGVTRETLSRLAP